MENPARTGGFAVSSFQFQVPSLVNQKPETRNQKLTILCKQIVEKNPQSGWSKRFQVRGARELDERRRTCAVRWSEAIERNEVDGPFSTAW
jgi:hypothetical protein